MTVALTTPKIHSNRSHCGDDDDNAVFPCCNTSFHDQSDDWNSNLCRENKLHSHKIQDDGDALSSRTLVCSVGGMTSVMYIEGMIK